MELTDLTVHELVDKLAKKEVTATQIAKAYIDRIGKHEKEVESFITIL